MTTLTFDKYELITTHEISVPDHAEAFGEFLRNGGIPGHTLDVQQAGSGFLYASGTRTDEIKWLLDAVEKQANAFRISSVSLHVNAISDRRTDS